MDATSVTLLDQLRGADRAAAWPRFVHLYTPLMLRWAGRHGVPRADQPDLIQDVFVVLLRVLPSFAYAPGQSFRGWLHTVFVNKWTDACRKKVPVPLAADGSDFPAPAVPDPVAGVDEREYCEVLVARAANLIRADFSPTTWKAFWATTAEDRPAGEVAAELGVSVNAVYLARSRVLARLRAELGGLLD